MHPSPLGQRMQSSFVREFQLRLEGQGPKIINLRNGKRPLPPLREVPPGLALPLRSPGAVEPLRLATMALTSPAASLLLHLRCRFHFLNDEEKLSVGGGTGMDRIAASSSPRFSTGGEKTAKGSSTRRRLENENRRRRSNRCQFKQHLMTKT
nr:hypothetical protein Iba_chr12aCG20960 [Ipomoea batatas]